MDRPQWHVKWGRAVAAFRLNPTAASLLGFLHERPLTGWELVRVALERIGDFWSLTRSQVYRELAAMERAGLVQAGPTGPRQRRPYTITAAGRETFAAWAGTEPGPETIRFPLLLMVAFGRHVPAERLAGWLRNHRAEHAARLDRYRAEIRSMEESGAVDAFAVATLGFGATYEQAVLEWFERLPAAISSGAGPSTADRD
jgi:DNA-binding PadR family transcriptional regulator